MDPERDKKTQPPSHEENGASSRPEASPTDDEPDAEAPPPSYPPLVDYDD